MLAIFERKIFEIVFNSFMFESEIPIVMFVSKSPILSFPSSFIISIALSFSEMYFWRTDSSFFLSIAFAPISFTAFESSFRIVALFFGVRVMAMFMSPFVLNTFLSHLYFSTVLGYLVTE